MSSASRSLNLSRGSGTATAMLAAFVALCALLSGTRSLAAEQPRFMVGFDVRNTQLEDARQYQPFLDYLAKATGYRFKIRFCQKRESVVDLLGKGEVHFAFIGAQTYLEARKKYRVTPMVRGLNGEGRAEYRSAIVVKKDSPIKRLEELRGKRFAFGGKSSTQGHLIPLIDLSEHGVNLADLAGHEFTGSHRNCAQAVATGAFDAGGMQDQLAREYAADGIIRIIHMSSYYPSSGVAAGPKVPAEIVQRVKKAFLDFQPKGRDAQGLYNWDKTEMASGFKEASDADYGELRRYALKFNLL